MILKYRINNHHQITFRIFQSQTFLIYFNAILSVLVSNLLLYFIISKECREGILTHESHRFVVVVIDIFVAETNQKSKYRLNFQYIIKPFYYVIKLFFFFLRFVSNGYSIHSNYLTYD